jgi:hypothetical protein
MAQGENSIFKEINQNRSVRFGVVSGLVGLAALLYFDKKPALGFAVFVTIVLRAALLQYLGQWRQDHVARRWMRVQAQLENGTHAAIPGRRRLYLVQANYSYSIQGSFYGGFYEAHLRTEQETIKLLEDLKRNRFWIRVDPANLDQSRLIPEER